MTTQTPPPIRRGDQISLTWPHKRLAVQPTNPNATHLESYPPRSTGLGKEGLLLYGDNFDSLSWLLASGYRGRVGLVYLDPPYNSNRTYTSRIRLRGKGQPTLGAAIAYDDVWQPGDYLQFLADRLLLLRELLHEDGTLWLHCDHRMQAHLLLLLEEIFGSNSHLNTVFWRSQTMRGAKVHARYFPNSAQAIHIFRSTPRGRPPWNAPKRELALTEEAAAAQYMRDKSGFFRTSDPGTYSFERLKALFEEGRLYAPYGGEVVVDEDAQVVFASKGGNIGVKYYLKKTGRNRYLLTRPVDNIWDDIAGLGTVPGEDENYPTQKTEKLLQRVLETASRPGDLILDPFAGSGTTLAVAHKLGREWIGCDSSWRAVRSASCRLSRHLHSAISAPSIDSDRAKTRRGDKDDGALGKVGYRILRVGVGGPQKDGRHQSVTTSTPGAKIQCERAGGRLTVRIDQFCSPQVALLAEEAKVSLPRDWREQVRAVLIDPDYDGISLRAALADAPAGKSALVSGVYSFVQSVDSEGQANSPLPDRAVAVRIVDVAGQEHLFVNSVRESGPPGHPEDVPEFSSHTSVAY
ncbi:MAG: site-specific DNA-methyltransferase [Caldilineaceae bacterium]|nr:site-specific DNA-methyltransferase [Caldilineaceae bacterium]